MKLLSFAVLLLIVWAVLKFALAITGVFLHILWIIAVIMFVLWLVGLVTGKKG